MWEVLSLIDVTRRSGPWAVNRTGSNGATNFFFKTRKFGPSIPCSLQAFHVAAVLLMGMPPSSPLQACHASTAALWASRNEPNTSMYCAPDEIDHMHKVGAPCCGQPRL